MKLAIDAGTGGFHDDWVDCAHRQGIEVCRVDCCARDAWEHLSSCDGLLWHWHFADPPAVLAARSLIPALGASGFPVYPDVATCWHFDDKVAQTRLLETRGIPTVPTCVFVRREEALAWVEQAPLPLVFKLRCGAASTSVWKVERRAQARRLVRRAFGAGFRRFRRPQNLRYAWGRFRRQPGAASRRLLAEALALFVLPSRAERVFGRERGYAYIQEFLPDNPFDTRIVVVGDTAVGGRRICAPGDWRASGRSALDSDPAAIDPDAVRLAFDVCHGIGAQTVAVDILRTAQGVPVVNEISYSFVTREYPGHWDQDLVWHPGEVNLPQRIFDAFLQECRW